jgi:hypothetical protein
MLVGIPFFEIPQGLKKKPMILMKNNNNHN